MKRQFLFSVVVLLIPSVGSPQIKDSKDDKRERSKIDLEGKVDDAHGKIAWKSTAQRADNSDLWTYVRSVKNLNAKLNCRVIWTNDTVRSAFTIKKGTEQEVSAYKLDSKPFEAAGEIVYNGGEEAGEGKAKAPAWLPTEIKTNATESSTLLSYEEGETVRQLKIRCSSTIKDEVIAYELAFPTVELSPKVKEYHLSFGKDSELLFRGIEDRRFDQRKGAWSLTVNGKESKIERIRFEITRRELTNVRIRAVHIDLYEDGRKESLSQCTVFIYAP